METLHRMGTFFILAGLALLVLFVGSILGKGTNAVILLLSLAAFFVGFMLRRNKPVKDSGRFGTIRRIRERSRQRSEDESDKQHEK
jgi:hypothetical protein